MVKCPSTTVAGSACKGNPLKVPDPDGVRRCLAHSQSKQAIATKAKCAEDGRKAGAEYRKRKGEERAGPLELLPGGKEADEVLEPPSAKEHFTTLTLGRRNAIPEQLEQACMDGLRDDDDIRVALADLYVAGRRDSLHPQNGVVAMRALQMLLEMNETQRNTKARKTKRANFVPATLEHAKKVWGE